MAPIVHLAGACAGAVAFAVTAFERRDCQHENSPLSFRSIPQSTFAGFGFPPDSIVLAVRW